MQQSRRDFLRNLATMAVVGAAFPLAEPAWAAKPGSRSIILENLNTGNRLNVVYAIGNKYVPQALSQLNIFLRDHHSGKISKIDPKLFDLLYKLRLTLSSKKPIQIICGYRSPATNKMLQQSGHSGVASQSLHMKGKAIDLRFADSSLADVRDAALRLKSGGVGYYPHEFVHVDTGEIRTW